MRNKKGQIQAVQPSVETSQQVVETAPIMLTQAAPEAGFVSPVAPKKSKKWLWILLGIIGVAIVGIVVWILLSGGEGSIVGSNPLTSSNVPKPPALPN